MRAANLTHWHLEKAQSQDAARHQQLSFFAAAFLKLMRYYLRVLIYRIESPAFRHRFGFLPSQRVIALRYAPVGGVARAGGKRNKS